MFLKDFSHAIYYIGTGISEKIDRSKQEMHCMTTLGIVVDDILGRASEMTRSDDILYTDNPNRRITVYHA